MSKKSGKSAADDSAGKHEPRIIQIPDINTGQFILRIKSRAGSSLITHKWSAKAQEMMADKQSKKPAKAKEARDPVAEYLDTIYRTPDNQPGIFGAAFKHAMVDACTFINGVTKVFVRGAFFVMADVLPLLDSEGNPCNPVMEDDMVRVGMGKADIRYRAYFFNWYANLPILYNTRITNEAQIANLAQIAGFSVGVGDWRPQKNGTHGMFEIVQG